MVSAEFGLNGKSALVAGDSRFWSRHVSVALAEAGADVAIAGKDSKKLDEAVAEVQRLGRKAVAITTDTTQSTQVQKMVDQAVAGLGKIDILEHSVYSEPGGHAAVKGLQMDVAGIVVHGGLDEIADNCVCYLCFTQLVGISEFDLGFSRLFC